MVWQDDQPFWIVYIVLHCARYLSFSIVYIWLHCVHYIALCTLHYTVYITLHCAHCPDQMIYHWAITRRTEGPALAHRLLQAAYLLFGTALHFTGLHYILCTALHCTALHCTALNCILLPCTVVHWTDVHYAELYYTALYCIALHKTTLQWTKSGFIILITAGPREHILGQCVQVQGKVK